MIQEIVGLRYEFVHRHGHYMMLYRDEGLQPEELSTHQLRMLESNAIPRLLPLEIQEIDFRIHLLYKLTSKRMLTHVLKVEGLTKMQLFKLLYTMVCTISDSGNYMLNEYNYVLKENFIFIGTDFTDIYLTYIPFLSTHEDFQLFRQIGGLVEHLGGRLKEEDRQVLKELLEACTETFSLSGFKQKLMDLMGEPKKAAVIPFPNLTAPLSESSSFRSLDASIGQTADSASIHNEDSRHPLVLSQRSKKIMLIVIILAAALLWSRYLEQPGTVHLHIISGVTIWLVNIWFILSYMGLPHPRNWTFGSIRLKRAPAKVPIPMPVPVNSFTNSHAQIHSHDHTFSNAFSSLPSSPSPSDLKQYYRDLHKHTTLLSTSNPGATVFLGGSIFNNNVQEPSVPVLEANIRGQKHKQFLTGPVFTIGRNADEVDFALNEVGVSRLHAEIIKLEEGYAIKDAGSKNGTFLNGESLVPYQAYKLQTGDSIRILKSEMIFHMN